VGSSMTSIRPRSDGNYPCPAAAGVFHAMAWLDDSVIDLRSLRDPHNCGNALAINDAGEIVGASENGRRDPATGAVQLRAVRWKDGEIENLGTFGGNHSYASAINSRGQIVGFALNKIPDPFSLFDFGIGGSTKGTQTRAFLWEDGHEQDLDTLGGPDAWAIFVNERGQVAGYSCVNSTPNLPTGVPAADPFLWSKDGGMIDLGTLGGTFGFPVGLNDRGQAIGLSNVAGDQSADPFLWDGEKLIDMFTAGNGGNFLFANAIDNTGEVIGAAAFSNHPFDAAIWRNGVVSDLGALPGDCFSQAFVMNSRGQIVGNSATCDGKTIRAALWEAGKVFDLNALIPHNSSLLLVESNAINDRGEIAGNGFPHGCTDFSCTHAFVLIPCDQTHSDDKGCGNRDESTSGELGQTSESPKGVPPENVPTQVRQRLSWQYCKPWHAEELVLTRKTETRCTVLDDIKKEKLMKSRVWMCVSTMAIFALLVMPVRLAAQEQQKANKTRYKLVDLGTLGGPVSSFGPFNSVILNEDGTAVGGADTSAADPNYPNFNPFVAPDPLDPFIQHAFLWQHGVMTDLGALPGTNSSYVNWVNASGVAAGNSENGSIDPLLGWPEVRGVVWKDGQIMDLGTLGGNETSASAINRQGWVVGTTTNAVSDTTCGLRTQCRAFLWDEKNKMRDIGTLGTGPDAFAVFVNDRGQVAGISLIDTTDPFSHAFLWQNGTMQDLGTLGGNFSQPNYLNNQGQVVGISTLARDAVTHPYLWNHGKMTDLGTFGGTFGEATWINDAGEVVGQANHAGDVIHTTFLWKNGVMKDLGVVKGDKCSGAYSMNSKGQIVGSSGLCGISIHGFLWENGHMIDLNSLIPPGVQLRYGININDRGEIAAVGKIPNSGDPDFYNFNDHAFLMIPCDENHRDTEVCKDGGESATTEASPARHAASSPTLPLSRVRESYRHHD
jgi:probable HAF family extracellular repeat protein